jgi:putative membrane protein
VIAVTSGVQPDLTMLANLTPFLLHWALTAFALWVASHVFKGMRFSGTGALVVSALLLGLANAIVRPLLVFLTLPLTLITFGLFLLVINAVVLMLVAKLVEGFQLDGFWTALWASLFMSVLSFVLGAFLLGGTPEFTIQTSPGQVWL